MMKKKPLMPVLAIMLLPIALVQVKVAGAHDQPGSLGSMSTAIDQYQVDCTDDGSGPSSYIDVSVKDEKPVAAPKVSVQVINGNVAKNSTDAVDGNAAGSPALIVTGSGNQSYRMTVDKTAVGAENYTVEYHCMTSDNQHTGTSITPMTNQ